MCQELGSFLRIQRHSLFDLKNAYFKRNYADNTTESQNKTRQYEKAAQGGVVKRVGVISEVFRFGDKSQ